MRTITGVVTLCAQHIFLLNSLYSFPFCCTWIFVLYSIPCLYFILCVFCEYICSGSSWASPTAPASRGNCFRHHVWQWMNHLKIDNKPCVVSPVSYQESAYYHRDRGQIRPFISSTPATEKTRANAHWRGTARARVCVHLSHKHTSTYAYTPSFICTYISRYYGFMIYLERIMDSCAHTHTHLKRLLTHLHRPFLTFPFTPGTFPVNGRNQVFQEWSRQSRFPFHVFAHPC